MASVVRTWKRASDRKACGAEWDCWIVSGAPYLELEGAGTEGKTWKKARCAKHAGEPVPDVIEDAKLPERFHRKTILPDELRAVTPMVGMAGLAKRVLKFDAKAAQLPSGDE